MKNKGANICTLNDLLFPVWIHDNEKNTNSEYSRVVTGIVTTELPCDENDILISTDIYPVAKKAKSSPFIPTKIVKNYEMDLNYCSPIYELVPNRLIFPEVEEILYRHGIKFSVVYSQIKHTRFYANFTIEDPRFTYKMADSDDVIKFVWNFQHSYNGLTKYKGAAGFFRLICSNGLTIPVEEMKQYNLEIEGKHTSSILSSLEKFSNVLTRIIEDIDTIKPAITAKYETLGNNWIAEPKVRLENVLKAVKINCVENANLNTVNTILGYIADEATDFGLGYKGRINDWLIYNGINQYINDDTRNISAPEKRKELDSKVLEYMINNQ